MQATGRDLSPLGRRSGADVARARERRDAAQRGRVRDWARGSRDPEVDCELAELMAEGVLTTEFSLADQRARWAYLEAAWDAAGRPRSDVDSARRAIARALAQPLLAA